MNLQTYIITALLAILADAIMGIIKKSPPYLFAPYIRLWKETVYLYSLLHDARFVRWGEESQKYISLKAIKAHGTKQKKHQPILDLLLDDVTMGKPVVLLGEPGSGKSTSLQVLTYHLSRTAYRSSYFLWLGLLLVATSLLFYSPILCLGWLASFVLWEFLGRRSIVPIFIESRSDYAGGIVTKWREEILTSQFKGTPLFGSFDRIVWIIDGINETPSNQYATFIEGWRVDLKKKKRMCVIFSSRKDENPALRLELDNTLTISNLDDKDVKEFIRVYGNVNASDEKNMTDTINRTFNKLLEEDLLDDDGIGRNPYWLKMIVESNFVTGNRGLLFLAFAKKLIQREIEEKPDERKRKPEWKTVPIDMEIDALANLAFAMQKEGRIGLKGDDVRRRVQLAISEIVEGSSFAIDDVLLEANAATLLQVKTRESVVFSHHLLQESFAAYALRNQKKWDTLNAIDDIAKWRGLLITSGELIESDNASTFDAFVRVILGEEPDINRLLIAISIVVKINDESNSTLSWVEEKFDTWLFKLIDSSRISDIIQCVQQEDSLGDLLVADFIASRLVVNLDKPERGHILADILVSLDELGAYALVAALHGNSILDKKYLVRIAYKIGESAFIPLLRDYDLFSSDIRHEVIGVMGRIQTPLAVDFLLKACEKTDDENLILAAFLLINIHATIFNYDTFLYKLDDSHAFVRWVSCYALGAIGNQNAISYLEKIREQDDDFFIFLEYPYNLVFPVSNLSLVYKSMDNLTVPANAKVSNAAEDALHAISDNTTKTDQKKGLYFPSVNTARIQGSVIKRNVQMEYIKGLGLEDLLGTL